MLDARITPKSNQLAIALMAISAAFRLFFAAVIPRGHDEVYYWDWGRDPRLSYFDHPPGVSWLSAGAQQIFGESTGGLQARGLVPLLHFVSSLILFKIYIDLAGSRRTQTGDATFIAITQLVPAFGIGGLLLLPDAGLLLFSSAGLFITLAIARRPGSLGLLYALGSGLIAGLAGLFKYHAAPIFGGMFLGLAAAKNWRVMQSKAFWTTIILTGLTVTLPVWIWNMQHGMASLSFQANRGISGAEIDLPRALRTLIGESLFLTPGFFGLLILSITKLWRHRTEIPQRIMLWASLPLLALIHLTMLYKEVLPHWGLPAFWLLIPEAAVLAGQTWSSKKLRLHLLFAATITAVILTVTAIPSVRTQLVTRTNGYPGALGEFTFWNDFSKSPQLRDLRERLSTILNQRKILSPIPADCPAAPIIASFRWFTTAQLAWSLPDKPMVRSFEPGKKYYYYDRDDGAPGKGCPILAIGEKAHVEPNEIQTRMDVLLSGDIVDERYLDRPISWWLGYLK